MGVFDLPGPLLTALDSLMSGLPAYPRLLIWAVVTGILSMALYWLCSNQDKTAAAKDRALTARKAMAAYQGTDFDEMLPLAKESLLASLRHFAIVLGPAVLSSLPALAIIVWVSGAFGYELPAPGSSINATTVPAVPLENASPNGTTPADGYRLAYPSAGATREVVATDGTRITALPLAGPVPVVHKKLWWNVLIGNPNGYLANDLSVDAIYFDLQSKEFLSIGPGWLRGWEFSYFVLLILVSLAVKVVFRIH